VRDILYLAWRYLVFNRWKTGILIAALTVIIFLPLALELVLDRSSERLRSRAADTPLLFGAPGSALELALNSLYFSGESPATLEYAMVDELGDTKLATAIPLHLRSRWSGLAPTIFRFAPCPSRVAACWP
jgi:putative ABC transport system permease protein